MASVQTDEFDGGIPKRGKFETTIWSDVVRAADPEDSRRAEALERLCRRYWYPVYVFVRRRGFNATEAQDRTQSFFAHLLEKDLLHSIDHTKGRFRSFLITAVKWHLANEWDRVQSLKRGSDTVVFSLDEELAESRFARAVDEEDTPEEAFDRQWARDILESAMIALRKEMESEGVGERFEPLSSVVLGDADSAPYEQLSDQLGLSVGGIKSAVRRMRRRVGELFREEITGTVTRPEEIQGEVKYLLALLRD